MYTMEMKMLADTFSYKVCEEGTTNCSASANVDITITNVNDCTYCH